jgi:hypothetical protein
MLKFCRKKELNTIPFNKIRYIFFYINLLNVELKVMNICVILINKNVWKLNIEGNRIFYKDFINKKK